MSFDSLGLSDFLLTTLNELGYGSATSVQKTAIPLVIKGGDLLAAAQTGSGKTAAFSLPILQRFTEEKRKSLNPCALILVPTRELADQVGESIARYGQSLPFAPRTLVAFGGVSYGPQMYLASKGSDIVVATPGRLIDLVEREVLSLEEIDTLVLDEADRLLALGFAEELNKILELIPEKRQNLLFSATFPEAVVEMADKLLVDPDKIEMEGESHTVTSIEQRAIEVERDSRTALLRHLMETENWERVLVFVGTKRRAENLSAKLAKNGIRSASLHGNLSQDKRSRALQQFKESKTRVLIATDVAARGIDIADLPFVVNYDLPRSTADYVHRIGRTGRAGKTGVAVNFVSQEDHKHFLLIEKRNEISLERERIEGFVPEEWNPEATVADKAPVKGKRKSKKDRKRDSGVQWIPKPRKDLGEVAEVASSEAVETVVSEEVTEPKGIEVAEVSDAIVEDEAEAIVENEVTDEVAEDQTDEVVAEEIETVAVVEPSVELPEEETVVEPSVELPEEETVVEEPSVETLDEEDSVAESVVEISEEVETELLVEAVIETVADEKPEVAEAQEEEIVEVVEAVVESAEEVQEVQAEETKEVEEDKPVPASSPWAKALKNVKKN